MKLIVVEYLREIGAQTMIAGPRLGLSADENAKEAKFHKLLATRGRCLRRPHVVGARRESSANLSLDTPAPTIQERWGEHHKSLRFANTNGVKYLGLL